MTILSDLQDLMREAFEGGQPGQPTMFLDGTGADGGGNHGVFATLAALSAEQASDPTALGQSVAAHAAHLAYYLEVGLRWVDGDRGPFDWKTSFEPAQVDEAGWAAAQQRLRTAYEQLMELSKSGTPDGDEALVNPAVHSAYHLGAIRQIIKLLTQTARA